MNLKQCELRKELAAQLELLKRNLAAVSEEILKTKYKKPYDELREQIRSTASAYVKSITLQDIRILRTYFEEAKPLITEAIHQSDKMKQISRAAFKKQNVEEIEQLALGLKAEIETALKPFYDKYLCLYLTEECFADPPKTPELYNEATGCIWKDGSWIPFQTEGPAVLLTIKTSQTERTAA